MHYQHGVLHNPCVKNSRYVGYLKEGCRFWQKEVGTIDEGTITKKCSICGRELPLDMFYQTRLTKDCYSDACRDCKPGYWISKYGKKNKKHEE